VLSCLVALIGKAVNLRIAASELALKLQTSNVSVSLFAV